MTDTRYTSEHEWVRLLDGQEGAGQLFEIGITEFAQEALGAVVFIELPEVGTDVDAGGELAVVESVKAAGEVSAPISGVVRELNMALVDEPSQVNDAPEGEGWIVRLEATDPSQLDALMTEATYREYLSTL